MGCHYYSIHYCLINTKLMVIDHGCLSLWWSIDRELVTDYNSVTSTCLFCITCRFYMGHNLSNKLCILNSLVVHLGMKVVVILQRKYQTCVSMLCKFLDCSLYTLIIPSKYFHSAQYDSKFLKEFEIRKKKRKE